MPAYFDWALFEIISDLMNRWFAGARALSSPRGSTEGRPTAETGNVARSVRDGQQQACSACRKPGGMAAASPNAQTIPIPVPLPVPISVPVPIPVPVPVPVSARCAHGPCLQPGLPTAAPPSEGKIPFPVVAGKWQACCALWKPGLRADPPPGAGAEIRGRGGRGG